MNSHAYLKYLNSAVDLNLNKLLIPMLRIRQEQDQAATCSDVQRHDAEKLIQISGLDNDDVLISSD